jgi:hypothetical protein
VAADCQGQIFESRSVASVHATFNYSHVGKIFFKCGMFIFLEKNNYNNGSITNSRKILELERFLLLHKSIFYLVCARISNVQLNLLWIRI